jgi:uncharacterized protein (TIGR02391 family)
MRGEYDVAVFEAMKAVEVAVRDASGFGADLLGKDLMREAFNPNEGPLAEGRAHLFAGAIQSYKNPGSHRDVSIEGPAEAAELVMLANHLLRIVDVRARAVK